jgi:type II restriction/modification system DNA methylase subunit YeeA
MDKAARRNLGAHYTSEKNILKLIKPLFLDGLWEEFEKIKQNKNRLLEFHQKLRRLNFLDPACGCGNFLVIAYRELRLLELEIMKASRVVEKQREINIHYLTKINVDQFFGIEIEEFPAQIAQVALWLMDHQMNTLICEEFGQYFVRIPLETSAKIVCGNALRIDWEEVVPARHVSYIMGNPPFVGAKFLREEQHNDLAIVFGNMKNSGILDYVAAWYVKAARMIKETKICCAFVSTSSITQGEQVGVLWSWMLAEGMKIFFAHRTFQWNNEARGKAAVHCVIIGFAGFDVSPKWLFEYEDIKGEPHKTKAQNINPYLVDAPNTLLLNSSQSICNVPEIGIGNQPIDGGNYLFTEEEKKYFLEKEPQAAPYFRRWLGADEFLNGYHRYCLWLGDCSPTELKKMPEALKRIEAVKNFRLASKRTSTVKLAQTPTRFLVERMPKKNFLIIPEVSSERRYYIPIGFGSPETLCSNLVKIAPDATFYHFGVISSLMHNAWMRAVAGRLESRYRYSSGIVYNNFPWPENPTEKQKQAIEAAAQGVLDARAQFPESSLADLYDPLTMPPVLLKAHQHLDKTVDAAYGKTNFQTEAQRVAFLFELYQKYTSLFAPEKPQRRGKS